jgi:hypothetical protein
MWGSLPTLETIAYISFVVGAGTGAIALIAGTITTVASNRVATLAQQQAKLEIGKAYQRAQEARLETERLRLSLKDRQLTPAQMQALFTALKGEDFDLFLAFNGENAEAAAFREQLDFVLKQTGLKVNFFSGMTDLAVGLKISAPLERKADQLKLESALKAAGLPYSVYPPPRPDQSFAKDLMLVVGAKPGLP